MTTCPPVRLYFTALESRFKKYLLQPPRVREDVARGSQ